MAVSLAEKLKTSLKLETDLIKGSNGIFDVEIDGKLVYSKNETGEFPDEESLIQKIRSDHSIG
jgi:selenoprotein W-related protein